MNSDFVHQGSWSVVFVNVLSGPLKCKTCLWRRWHLHGCFQPDSSWITAKLRKPWLTWHRVRFLLACGINLWRLSGHLWQRSVLTLDQDYMALLEEGAQKRRDSIGFFFLVFYFNKVYILYIYNLFLYYVHWSFACRYVCMRVQKAWHWSYR